MADPHGCGLTSSNALLAAGASLATRATSTTAAARVMRVARAAPIVEDFGGTAGAHITGMTKRILSLIALSLFGVLFATLDCSGGGACADGKNCSCANCVQECPAGSGCNMTCTGGSCTFDCPKGGCNVNATNGASIELSCKGGGCVTTCASGAASCNVKSCSTGCNLSCNGATSCAQTCDVEASCLKSP